MAQTLHFDIERSRDLLRTLLNGKQLSGWPLLFCALAARVEGLALQQAGHGISGARLGDFDGGARITFAANPHNRGARKNVRVIEIVSSNFDPNAVFCGGEIEPNDMILGNYGIPETQNQNHRIDPEELLAVCEMRRGRGAQTGVADPVTIASTMVLKKFFGPELRGMNYVIEPVKVLIGEFDASKCRGLKTYLKTLIAAASKEISEARTEKEMVH